MLLVGIIVVLSFLLYRFVVWIREARLSPDPWEPSLPERLDEAEAEPLCTRCLCPHPEEAWFCPHCGLPASATTNFSPFLWVFSLGDAFRAFVAGAVRIRPLTVVGFLLTSLIHLSVLGPLYWVALLWNADRDRASPPLQPAASK